ncbi:MAG: PIN domain-containing protein [Cyanobacteria bacterium P01_D01_bin.73]
MTKVRAVSDTSFVIAFLDNSESLHDAVVQQYDLWEELLLPEPALAEVAYYLHKWAGNVAVARFLNSLPNTIFNLVTLEPVVISRVAELLEIYADTRIDFVDACVMAIAEHYQIETVLTLDRRDFTIVRPVHCESFTLLP